MRRSVLEELGQAGGHEVERDRRAGEHRDAAAKAHAARRPSRARRASARSSEVRHRRRIIAAAGDGTGTLYPRAPKSPVNVAPSPWPGAPSAMPTPRSLVAAVEEDRPVPGRGQPRAHDRRRRRAAAAAPRDRLAHRPRRGAVEVAGAIDALLGGRARRRVVREEVVADHVAAVGAGGLRQRARRSSAPRARSAARLVDEAHGRADGSIERRGGGAAAGAGAGGRGSGGHERARHCGRHDAQSAVSGHGWGDWTFADDALIRADPRILPDLGVLETRWALIAPPGISYRVGRIEP